MCRMGSRLRGNDKRSFRLSLNTSFDKLRTNGFRHLARRARSRTLIRRAAVAMGAGGRMIFEQTATGGSRSYWIGCADTHAAALIDPELSRIDHYLAVAARNELRIRYVIDTHTHADHFSATAHLAKQLGVPVAMHRTSPAPFVDMRVGDGEMIIVGKLRLQVIHTPGHTQDSMCLVVDDRVFTGDTLLIGATGRTDLPTGDPDALYDSLFGHLLRLEPTLKIFPAHDYKGRDHSTIAQELADNPRLQARERGAFVEVMRALNLTMPTHITEALRTNMSGGKTVSQLLAEAAATGPFLSPADMNARHARAAGA